MVDDAQGWRLDKPKEPQGRIGLPVIPVANFSQSLVTIADRFYGAPSLQLEVFGVSGRLGKTTLCHLASRGLEAELPCGVIDASVGIDLFAAHRRLDALRAQGLRAVLVELAPDRFADVGAGALRLSHLLLTHLGPGPSAGGLAQSIAQRLASPPTPGWVIANLDDPAQLGLIESLPASICVAGYALGSKAPRPSRCDLLLEAVRVETMPRGLRIQVRCLGGEGAQAAELEVGLIGEFNAANLLAVLALKCSRGLPLERAAQELASVRGVAGRMECFGGENAPLIVVDSAQTPAELERALSSLRRHGFRRIMTVVGCDGRMAADQRALVGGLVERLSDKVILTDNNPRGVAGERIVADILAGMTRADRVSVERQRGLAIRIAVARAAVGDAVLIVGKGQERVQDMGELKVHFSDRAQVVEALREWREGHH
ncbi:UDP-N-acetylmuramoylalanyl-D-glutamate--2,6-diaminopimelate ligase [Thiorhodococcus mannitoliphagus]|uniref:UDP-N-acetylmuramoylalanyl-D-glutamate--2, 6-diaminopimelate ligase n=2 Tax=Thiorhodococcus mannitoliphagus TaxID=329406 RepID=A0A6P1DKW6_9GAMM|nr:UDP-N-acetylmuramoylalanyl-D-glutamate--2,6-diaminopimelate ligase [Thiorhodococcus mannitoliphagus]